MTSNAVSPRKRDQDDGRHLSPEQTAAAAMVAEAWQRGLELTGPNGLLKLFTKNVLETALNEEMTEHLGHEKASSREGFGVDERAQWQPGEDGGVGRGRRGPY
jgi:transposase-like protein